MRFSLLVPALLAVALLSNCSSQTNLTPPSAKTPPDLPGGRSQYREKVLDNFSSPGYGANFVSPLTADGHGDYFGTTAVGGTGHGTVYELIPRADDKWKAVTLHSFTGGLDGGTPAYTPVILDKVGDLYGVTDDGGSDNSGVAYELSRSGTTWAERVLYTFGAEGSVGVHPFSFIADSKGSFFGTVDLVVDEYWTEGVFELSPASSTGWTASLIFVDDIVSATSGGGGLTIDPNENIFGVSSLAFEPSEIFELSPSGSTWSSKILYTFPDIDLYPEAPPVLDKLGNIYGATVAGGAAEDGTIYELTPADSGSWKYKTLYAFKGGYSDGEAPYAGITFDHSGNIYGTTSSGGAHHVCSGGYMAGCGTVYELTPSGQRYRSKLLWSFDGKDGSEPFAPVLLDARGDAFGTTTQGGKPGCSADLGCGNAYEIQALR